MNYPIDDRPIYGATAIPSNRVYRAVASLDKIGFTVAGRRNSDAFYQIGKGGSLSVLFSNYKSDCGIDYVNFEGTVPIFLDLQRRLNSYNEVTNSDIAINGIGTSVSYLISGNSYCLRYPKNFGKMLFEKNNSHFYIDELLDKDTYYETVIHPRSVSKFTFTVSFQNLPLVSLRFSIFKPRQIDANVLTLKHYLNFYNFTLENDRWLLDSPSKMLITLNEKNQYSYFKTSGDKSCFYINGYNSPIIIFAYNKQYTVENKNKKDSPFYFDFYPEGMYKKPYNDFDNDINTDRLNLFFVFKSITDPFSRTYENLEIDPYIDIDFNRAVAYDPDNMYYACSNKRYSGNKIYVGRKSISYVSGMYGMTAPDFKKFTFNDSGSYVVYDYFEHVAGKVMNVDVIDYSTKVITSQDQISSISLSPKDFSFVDQKPSNLYVSLIGDMFVNIEEFAAHVVSGGIPAGLPQSGNITIKINTSYFENNKLNPSLFAYHYSKYNKDLFNLSDTDFYNQMYSEIDGYIKKIVSSLRSYRVFEVNVEFEKSSTAKR